MKPLMDYPLFNGAAVFGVLFVIFLFVPPYDFLGRQIALVSLGIIGIIFWIAFFIRWNRDKELIAKGEIVRGKLIRDSIRYTSDRSGYRISAKIAVFNDAKGETLLFKDTIEMTYYQAPRKQDIPENVYVKVIYDKHNPGRNIVYLRDALGDIRYEQK